MESEQSYAGHGWFPDEKDFYTFSEIDVTLSSKYKNSLGGIYIGNSLDVVHHTRVIYSILEVLEELGGLFAILCFVGNGVVGVWEWVFGSKFKSFLVRKIFKANYLLITAKSMIGQKLQSGGNASFFKSANSKQKARNVRKAYEKVQRELDIVTFIRK